MARYVKELVLNKPDSFVSFIMEDYLRKNDFKMSEWKKKESAYRAGDRVLEGYKFLKWSYINGTLHIEAWIKGSFGKEMGLTGFVAAVQKGPYRKSLEQLFEVMKQDIPEGEEGGQTQPILVKTVNNSGAATAALVFGILSIVAALVIPLAGLICACVGYSRARMGSGSSNANLALAGKILSIIGAILSVIIYALNVVYSFSVLF